MKSRTTSALAIIAIASALVFGTGLFVPNPGSANPATPGPAPGEGGVQVINADGYGPYPGSNVGLPTYACATIPCTKDVKVKVDIPSATFPASIEIFYDMPGSGWQNQVFFTSAPLSIMSFPHNTDLGGVAFSQYGVYVLVFANTEMQPTSWQYFQVQQGSAQTQQTPAPANGLTTTTDITGTFKVVNTTILATSIRDGINTTDSVSNIARNDSFNPGVITGRINVEIIKHVDVATGDGTSFGVGTFTGMIIGKGPGQCAYRISSTLTAQGTSQASSTSTHWLTECTGGLQGITETTTSIGKGNFTAVVTFQPPSAPAPQGDNPYGLMVVAAAALIVTAVYVRKNKENVSY